MALNKKVTENIEDIAPKMEYKHVKKIKEKRPPKIDWNKLGSTWTEETLKMENGTIDKLGEKDAGDGQEL